MRVRHQHDIDVRLFFNGTQPFALFVDEIGGHVHRYLHDDARSAILACVLADQAQDRQRQRFDTAYAADAGAARAHQVTRFTQARTQPLA